MKKIEMYKMRIFIYIMIFLPFTIFAQKKDQKVGVEIKITSDEKNLVRDGNDLYKQNSFVDAEVKYKKALENNPNYETANFNLGNAIYEQNRFKEAAPFYEMVTKTSKDKLSKSEAFHNVGNISMKEKKYAQAVEAYKNALRQNSKDEETRYNLALAKKLLEQEKQQQDKDDKNKDKKDQDKKDQQNKDDQNKDQDKEENKDKNDQNKNNENKDQQNKDQQDKKDKNQEKQQPKPNELSKQQMEQLLEAMNNEENKTQKKVNAKKAKGRKVKQEKDW